MLIPATSPPACMSARPIEAKTTVRANIGREENRNDRLNLAARGGGLVLKKYMTANSVKRIDCGREEVSCRGDVTRPAKVTAFNRVRAMRKKDGMTSPQRVVTAVGDRRAGNRSISQESVTSDRLRTQHRGSITKLSRLIEANYNSNNNATKDNSKIEPLTQRRATHFRNHYILKKGRPLAERSSSTLDLQTATQDCRERKRPALLLPEDSGYNNIVSFMEGVKRIIGRGKEPSSQAEEIEGLTLTHDRTTAFVSTSASTRDIFSSPAEKTSEAGKRVSEVRCDSRSGHKRCVLADGKVVEPRRPSQPTCSAKKNFRQGRHFRAFQSPTVGLVEAGRCKEENAKEEDTAKTHRFRRHKRCAGSMGDFSAAVSFRPEPSQTATVEMKEEELVIELKKELHADTNEDLRLVPTLRAGLLRPPVFAVSDVQFVVPGCAAMSSCI